MAEGRYVYTVVLPTPNPKTGQPIFVLFECALPTLDMLVSDLNDGQIVTGSALRTRLIRENDDNTGERIVEVLARRPYAVARAGVARIETPHRRLVEYEE